MQEGICPSCKSYVPSSARLCSRDDTRNERAPCSKWESGEKYTIVIGHRRAAAAKLGGVEKVPCVISNMSPREQVETMLLENMQRSDLTVLEQARGFQMMLDFGSSIDEVAQRTGFSPSTVRRRVKLMELDQKHLEKAVARGGSLMDYMELDRIDDPALRDEVLCSIGTDNFKATLQNALRKEKNKARMIAWEAVISTFAQKIDKRDYIGEEYYRMDYFRNYYEFNNKSDTVEIPADVATVKYFYIVGRDQIDIYKEHTERVDPAEEARKIASDEFHCAMKQVREISAGHYQLRMDFVRDFKECKKHMWGISMLVGIALVFTEITYNDGIDIDAVKQLLGLDIKNKMDFAEVIAVMENSDVFTTYPERVVFSLAYAAVDNKAKYWETRWDPNQGRSMLIHRKNPKLDMLYAILCEMGYQMSDEEREMQSGKHEMLEPDPYEKDVDDDDNEDDVDEDDDAEDEDA